MSLFQLKEWWHVKAGEDEEFDGRCFAIGNVDNEPSGAAKIAIGSLEGVLRIFYPRTQEYRCDDLIVEERLDLPILQLAIAAFLPSSLTAASTTGRSYNGLAVLHPRKLVVYALEGVVDQGAKTASYYNLVKSYEHAFGEHYTASNMVWGPFGGASAAKGSARDLLAVQSMDGKLQIFEQEAHAFTRRLTGTLLPGPLVYVPKTDSFITANSQFEVQSFRYQALATAADDTSTVTGRTPRTMTDLSDTGGAVGALSMTDTLSDTLSTTAAPKGLTSTARPGTATHTDTPHTRAHTHTHSSEDAKGGVEYKGIVAAKRVQADWSVCIGEGVLDIAVGRFTRNSSTAQPDIIVLGERSIFVLNDSGVIKLEKRLEVPPICMVAYARSMSAEGNADNLMVATNHSPSHLLIYKEQQLVWSARVATVPVALGVSMFGGVRGLVVQLDERGSLTIGYLGTDAPTTSVVTTSYSACKDLNHEEVDKEHRKLLAIIREAQSEIRSEPRERVVLRVQCPKVLDRPDSVDQQLWDKEFAGGQVPPARVPDLVKCTCRIFVTYTGTHTLNNVTLTMHTPPHITPSEMSVCVPTLRGAASTPVIVPIIFSANARHMPSDANVTIAAVYEDAQGQPRTAQYSFRLPLVLSAFLAPPVKQDAWKLTLETSRAPIPVIQLFDDMLAQPGLTQDNVSEVVGVNGTNALSFRYWWAGPGGEPVFATVMASTTGRYRVQSDSLAATWLLFIETYRRLQEHFEKVPPQGRRPSSPMSEAEKKGGESKDGGTRSKIEYTDAVPLDGLMDVIDAHFKRRQELRAAQSLLNDRAHQFRVVEKRLLMRFKEKNPAPLNGLDLIMARAYEQVMEAAHMVQSAQTHLCVASEELSCAVRLVNFLMKLRFSMDEESCEILESHLSPEVKDLDEQGWEEMTMAGMTHLLRTSLAKTARDPTLAPQSLAPLTETSRLKKHIAVVCDRIGKGAKLSAVPAPPDTSANTGESKVSSSATTDEAAMAPPPSTALMSSSSMAPSPSSPSSSSSMAMSKSSPYGGGGAKGGRD